MRQAERDRQTARKTEDRKTKRQRDRETKRDRQTEIRQVQK